MSAMPDNAGAPSQFPISPIVLDLSLKGLAIQSQRFEKEVVTVGRDPNCDVWVDNPGVSRQHFRLEWTDSGEWRVVDGGSANGTFLNEKPVRVATVRSGDVVQFAKYSLEVTVDELVGGDASARPRDRASEGATVMLTPSQVRQMVQEARSTPQPAPVPVAVVTPAVAPRSEPAAGNGWVVWAIVTVVVAGAAAAIWGFLQMGGR